MWKNKYVAVTGGNGMIGRELVEQLDKLGANVVVADLPADLTKPEVCDELCNRIDYIFHLAGVKGNPRMTKEKPVDFMEPMLKFDTNMICSAQKHNIKKFLYTSSIAVENPESDKYPAWAKETAEKLIEAMRIQYPKGTKYCVVRPANVFGRYDNPNKKECMVITDLIRKAMKDDKLVVWGDGNQERDFISAKDVARGMIKTMESMPEEPISLCSGVGIKIKDIAKFIVDHPKTKAKELLYDKTKPTGTKKKIMKPNYKKIGFSLDTDALFSGLKEVIELW